MPNTADGSADAIYGGKAKDTIAGGVDVVEDSLRGNNRLHNLSSLRITETYSTVLKASSI